MVPFAVEAVAPNVQAFHLLIGHPDAERGYSLSSIRDWIFRPVRAVVAAMNSTMALWLIKWRPRRFLVMWRNMRCSILFHLLVPGGKWQIEAFRPISSARGCSSNFRSRLRLMWEPPPSAVIRSLRALR